MTITVTAEIIEGASFSLGNDGVRATRVFKVVTTAGESWVEILSDSGLPQSGDLHPDTSYTPTPGEEYYASIAKEFSVVPDSGQPNVFIVTVGYLPPDPYNAEPSTAPEDSIIQVGSSVTTAKTQKNNAGSQLVVSLTGQPDQTGEVEIQVPETVIMFERKEAASPYTKAVTHVGTVNSVSLGSGTFAVKTLLCLGIEGTSNDGGQTWNVTYRFQYRRDTWDAEIVYIDPETDRPHNDIDLGTSDGVLVAEIYPETDFGDLDLDW